MHCFLHWPMHYLHFRSVFGYLALRGGCGQQRTALQALRTASERCAAGVAATHRVRCCAERRAVVPWRAEVRALIWVSWHNGLADVTSPPQQCSWEQFVERLRVERPRGARSDAELFVPARRTGPLAQKNVSEVTAYVWDLDTCTDAEVDALCAGLGAHVRYRTMSYGSKPGARTRVVAPLSRAVSLADWPRFWSTLNRVTGALNDRACKDAGHKYFAPVQEHVEHVPGAPLDVDEVLALSSPVEALDLETEPLDALDLRSLASRLQSKRDPAAQRVGAEILALAEGRPYAEPGDWDNACFRICKALVREYKCLDVEAVGLMFDRCDEAMGRTRRDARTKLERLQRRALNMPDAACTVIHDASDHTVAGHVLGRLGQCVYADGSLYQYDAGTWAPVTDTQFYAALVELDGAFVAETKTTFKIYERVVRGARLCASLRESRPTFFADAPTGIAFENVYVELRDGEAHVREHDPDNRARVMVPVDYDPSARAPRWEALLDNVWLDDPDRTEKKHMLQEFVGAALAGVATSYDSALVMYGSGSNGKSTLIECIKSLFPTYTSVQPHEWGNEYKCAMLAGSLLNVSAELPSRTLGSTDVVKAVISGDAVTARVIRESPFTFTPRAAHLFAANELPETKDTSPGFWRRMLVLTFNREFSPRDGGRTTPEILASVANELPGIYVWAFEGLRRLVTSGGYTLPPSHAEAITSWRHDVDPLSEWVDTCTRPCEGTDVRVLYAAFERWARDQGVPDIPSMSSFGRRLKSKAKKTRSNGATRYALEVR